MRPDRTELGAAALVVAAVASVLVGVTAVLPLVAVIALAVLLGPQLSIGARLVVAAAVLVPAVLAVTAAVQPLGAGLHPLATFLPIVLAPLARAVWRRRGAPRGPASRSADSFLPRSAQLWSLVPTTAFVALFGFLVSSGYVAVPGGSASTAVRTAVTAHTEDGGTHYVIYREVAQNGGFTYASENGRWTYPQGFHVLAGAVDRAVARDGGPRRDQVSRQFDAFWLTTMFVYALLAGMTGVVVHEVARRCGVRSSIGAVIGVATTATVAFGFPSDLLTTGFFPQITALALLLAMVVCACVLDSRRVSTMITIGGFAFAISATWFFLTPVAAVCALGWAWMHRSVLLERRMASGAVAVVTLIAATLPLLGGSYLVSGATANAPGGVEPVSRAQLIGLVIVAWAVLLVALTDEVRRRLAVLVITFGASCLFAIAFREYQEIVAGGTAYFYEKSLYTVFLLAAIVTAALLAVCAQRATAELRSARALVLVLGLAIGALSLSGIFDSDARSTNALWNLRDGKQSTQLAPVIGQYYAAASSLEDADLLVWDVVGENRYVDFLTTRWLNAVNGRRDGKLERFITSNITEQSDAELARFVRTREYRDERLVIYTRDIDALRERLERRLDADQMRHIELMRASM